MSQIDFNAAEVEPSTPLELITPGEYTAIIVESERKPTKNGTGSFLELKLQICDQGKFQNRNVFARLNLWNASQTAQQIGRAEFSAICRAVNVPSPRNSEELHNKPLTVVIKTEKRADTGDLANVVKGFKPRKAPTLQQTSVASPASSNPW